MVPRERKRIENSSFYVDSASCFRLSGNWFSFSKRFDQESPEEEGSQIEVEVVDPATTRAEADESTHVKEETVQSSTITEEKSTPPTEMDEADAPVPVVTFGDVVLQLLATTKAEKSVEDEEAATAVQENTDTAANEPEPVVVDVVESETVPMESETSVEPETAPVESKANVEPETATVESKANVEPETAPVESETNVEPETAPMESEPNVEQLVQQCEPVVVERGEMSLRIVVEDTRFDGEDSVEEDQPTSGDVVEVVQEDTPAVVKPARPNPSEEVTEEVKPETVPVVEDAETPKPIPSENVVEDQPGTAASVEDAEKPVVEEVVLDVAQPTPPTEEAVEAVTAPPQISIVDREVVDAITHQPETFDQVTIETPDAEEVSEKPATLADHGRQALLATKSKIQTTLSRGKKNLQVTGQKLQTRLSGTLAKRRRAKKSAGAEDDEAADEFLVGAAEATPAEAGRSGRLQATRQRLRSTVDQSAKNLQVTLNDKNWRAVLPSDSE